MRADTQPQRIMCGVSRPPYGAPDSFDWIAASDALVAALSSLPLLREMAREVVIATSQPVATRRTVTKPLDVLKEQAMNAYGLLLGNHVGVPAKDLTQSRVGWATVLLQATPYLWKTAVWDEMCALGDTIPSHTVGHFELGGVQYWCTEDTDIIHSEITPGTWEKVDVDGYLISQLSTGLQWAMVGRLQDGATYYLPGGVIPTGSVFPDDYLEDKVGMHTAGRILAGLAFLESPYIPKRVERPDRAARRRLSITKGQDSVTFVDLRSSETAPSHDDPATGLEPTRWNWRWFVRGHWRNQWFPSTQSHKLIYVPPYVKGPEDKPLKQTVYRVVR